MKEEESKAIFLLDPDLVVIGFGYMTPGGFVISQLFNDYFYSAFEEQIKIPDDKLDK